MFIVIWKVTPNCYSNRKFYDLHRRNAINVDHMGWLTFKI